MSLTYNGEQSYLGIDARTATPTTPTTYRSLLYIKDGNLCILGDDGVEKILFSNDTEILPIDKGGTGVSSIVANRVLKSNTSTSVVEHLTGTGFVKLTSDVPSVGELVATDIPSLDTGKLTTGTMPLARGGTGVSSITANRVLKSNTSTSVVEPLTGTGFIKLTSDVPSVGALVAADIPALDTSTVLIEDGTDIAARLVGFKSPSWHCDTAFSGQGFTWATDSGFGGAMSTTTISGTYLLLGNSSLAEHFAYKTPATTMSMYMRCVKGTSAVYVGIRFDDWNGSTVSNFAELRIAGATTRGIKFVVRRTGQSDATYYDNTIPAEFILWGYKGGSTDIRFTIFTSSSPSFGDRLLSVNPGWAATRYGIIASTGGTDSAYRNTIDFFHVV